MPPRYNVPVPVPRVEPPRVESVDPLQEVRAQIDAERAQVALERARVDAERARVDADRMRADESRDRRSADSLLQLESDNDVRDTGSWIRDNGALIAAGVLVVVLVTALVVSGMRARALSRRLRRVRRSAAAATAATAAMSQMHMRDERSVHVTSGGVTIRDDTGRITPHQIRSIVETLSQVHPTPVRAVPRPIPVLPPVDDDASSYASSH
jgi:hypothetical protein